MNFKNIEKYLISYLKERIDLKSKPILFVFLQKGLEIKN